MPTVHAIVNQKMLYTIDDDCDKFNSCCETSLKGYLQSSATQASGVLATV